VTVTTARSLEMSVKTGFSMPVGGAGSEEQRTIHVRRARAVDTQAVLNVINAAYVVEEGKANMAFRKEPRYQSAEQVQHDILLARQEENVSVFFIATEKHKKHRKQSDEGSSLGLALAIGSSPEKKEGAGSMVKSMASALGSMIGGSSAKKEAAAASTNGKQGLTTSDSTITLASSASGATSPGSSTPGGSRETIVGVIRVMLRKFGGDKCIDFSPFAVHPAYQQQGIGSLLLRATYDWARKRSVRRCVIEVCNLRTDLFSARPGSKDEYLGVTDPRSTSQGAHFGAGGKLPASGPGATTASGSSPAGGGNKKLLYTSSSANSGSSAAGGSGTGTNGGTTSSNGPSSPGSPANKQKAGASSGSAMLPAISSAGNKSEADRERHRQHHLPKTLLASTPPQQPPSPGLGQTNKNKKPVGGALPWTRAGTADASGAAPLPPPTPAGAGSAVQGGASGNGNGSALNDASTSSTTSSKEKEEPPRITSKDIAQEAQFYPDLKRACPGTGIFGRIGFAQIGTLSPDEVLDPEPGMVSRPGVHFLLLSRMIPLVDKS